MQFVLGHKEIVVRLTEGRRKVVLIELFCMEIIFWKKKKKETEGFLLISKTSLILAKNSNWSTYHSDIYTTDVRLSTIAGEHSKQMKALVFVVERPI